MTSGTLRRAATIALLALAAQPLGQAQEPALPRHLCHQRDNGSLRCASVDLFRSYWRGVFGAERLAQALEVLARAAGASRTDARRDALVTCSFGAGISRQQLARGPGELRRTASPDGQRGVYFEERRGGPLVPFVLDPQDLRRLSDNCDQAVLALPGGPGAPGATPSGWSGAVQATKDRMNSSLQTCRQLSSGRSGLVAGGGYGRGWQDWVRDKGYEALGGLAAAGVHGTELGGRLATPAVGVAADITARTLVEAFTRMVERDANYQAAMSDLAAGRPRGSIYVSWFGINVGLSSQGQHIVQQLFGNYVQGQCDGGSPGAGCDTVAAFRGSCQAGDENACDALDEAKIPRQPQQATPPSGGASAPPPPENPASGGGVEPPTAPEPSQPPASSPGGTVGQPGPTCAEDGCTSYCDSLEAWWRFFSDRCDKANWSTYDCTSFVARTNGCVDPALINPGPDGNYVCRARGSSEWSRERAMEMGCERRQLVAEVDGVTGRVSGCTRFSLGDSSDLARQARWRQLCWRVESTSELCGHGGNPRERSGGPARR